MIIYLSLLRTDSDRDVFQRLYEENEQIFFRTAMKLLQNEADAEDAVQACFLKMIDNFADYRHKPYIELVRICHIVVKHNALDILRDRQKKVNFTDEAYSLEEHIPDLAPDVLEQVVEKYERSLVHKAITMLEPIEQEVLILQYVMDLKPREIANLLSMKPSAVRKKAMRCRMKLAKILEGLDYDGLR